MVTIISAVHFIFTISILFFFFLTINFSYGENYEFVKSITHHHAMKQLRAHDHGQKFSHFRFFWHDILSGPNPTSIRVIKPSPPTDQLPNGFGSLYMFDNPLTVEPELSSKLVGRGQGFYASTSQEELALLMTMNIVLLQGKYNGSTITVLGRNSASIKVREMPVIGGSGLFRFARGYAQAKTYSFDSNTGDAIVEYNVYVLH